VVTRRETRKPVVTAGFTWYPEIGPSVDASARRMSPKANAVVTTLSRASHSRATGIPRHAEGAKVPTFFDGAGTRGRHATLAAA
jgi:hypothetical protein